MSWNVFPRNIVIKQINAFTSRYTNNNMKNLILLSQLLLKRAENMATVIIY